MRVLVLNCGSSSLKFAVYDTLRRARLASGAAQRLGSSQASLAWTSSAGGGRRELPAADVARALRELVALLEAEGLRADLEAIGHRVVHGGSRFCASTLISEDVVREIEACVPLGPLHNPANLLGIAVAGEVFPGLPQAAVFDTAFHQTMPPRAYTYPVPLEWLEQHQVRRYGFHGTSHRYVSGLALRALGLEGKPSALVTAHLGNGCSLAAIRDGRSVDTTMGLTPLEGVMMGTRAGSVDPSLVCHMAQVLEVPPARVGQLLNTASGLLGVSGLSNDLRELEHAAAAGHRRAELALELFCYQLAKQVAALVVPLGQLDALVFTGGIGENSVQVRARVLRQLGFLGLREDPAANALHGRQTGGRVSLEGPTRALVIPTDEELLIALDTAELAGPRLRATG